MKTVLSSSNEYLFMKGQGHAKTTTCNSYQISSALDTRHLNFPPHVAAKIMMESVAAMKDSGDYNGPFCPFGYYL